ncbi:hypothetical protein H8I69_16690 [Serratia fonticola]|uniref:hypothetical protein n=1 Tax=Serratia fonticola TaxID=47917 RepID=UPI0015C6959E|nr:hypothetical protein [Serratia fonticola]MBC3380754.1 hypothetical protein [Serratia fonticola]NYA39953.1 hypothetical protein [Serratia fonticola]
MKNELKNIMEKLDSDYAYLHEELLCSFSPVYCAYLNSTSVFLNDVIDFVDEQLKIKESFNYIISSYIEMEEIFIFKHSDDSSGYRFVVREFELFTMCNCLEKHRNVISHESIIKHEKLRNRSGLYKYNYIKKLSDSEIIISKANNRINKIKNLTDKEELIDFIFENYFHEMISAKDDMKKGDVLKKQFFYYHIIKSMIDRYKGETKKSSSIFELDMSVFTELYDEHGISINKEDIQFHKYELLSMDDNFILNHSDLSAIFDKRINIGFTIHTSNEVLKIFEHLIDEHYIKNIALKPMSIIYSDAGQESVERGTPLTSQIKKLPELSCFYDISYENKLIIGHNKAKQEVTFEEMRGDFSLEDDFITTQVIHLKYNEVNGEYFIEHLDHEYIRYEIGEYENKETNVSQKGTAGKVKTFKIDNSAIPFFYKFKGSYFLHIILESYFLNKDLLTEYFENMNFVHW